MAPKALAEKSISVEELADFPRELAKERQGRLEASLSGNITSRLRQQGSQRRAERVVPVL